MSTDGTYGFAYCGQIGVGVGVITIKNNMLKGADLSGGRYSGAVSERPNGAGYKIVYDMFVPPHVFLVQGGSPQEMAHTRSDVTLGLPPDFDNGEPIKLMIPPGEVTLMIRRISDEYAAYASGVKLTITPEV
jgi:hypothetical protein